jgi:hypothetical protein
MKIYEVTNGIQGQIKRSNANEVEVEDPNKPGVVTKIDLKKAAVTQDEQGNTVVTPNSQKPEGPNTLRPGAKITISQ